MGVCPVAKGEKKMGRLEERRRRAGAYGMGRPAGQVDVELAVWDEGGMG